MPNIKSKLCFNKSFASHPKSKCWDSEKNGEVKPINIRLATHKKYWFICDVKECNHEFESMISNITKKNPTWCPYCTNQRLCQDNKCKICFEKSFASHPKAKYWNYKKNKGNPINIFKRTSKKYWFNCDKCSHDFESTLSHISKKKNPSWCPYCCIPCQKICENDECKECFEKSFASHPKAKYWNLTKNLTKNGTIIPRNIIKGTHKKYWFNCNKCSHDFESSIRGITRKDNPRWCPYCCIPCKKLCENDECKECFEKTFASHSKAKYWNSTKNGTKIPRNILKYSNKKYWFNCDKCSHDFESTLSDISNKNHPTWCPYCCIPCHKLCENDECKECFEKSFASHQKAKYWNSTKNGTIIPRNILQGSEQKFYFNCDKCSHIFNKQINSINRSWCPYCSNQTLCEDEECKECFEKSFASHPNAEYWHPTKNGTVKPRNITKGTGKKHWFNCNKCSHDFESIIKGINWCPKCINKTEFKLYNFLINNLPNIEIKKEYTAEWCKNKETNCYYRYDFYIPDLNIIIELDGVQHFKYVKFFKNDVEKRQAIDKYKMKQASKQGITFIRITQEYVLDDRNDWKEQLILCLQSYDKSQEIYICGNNEYDCYQNNENVFD
jgi:very-short-patch-repair endonuclease